MANLVQIVIQGIDKSDKAFTSSKSNLIALEKIAKTAAVTFAVLAGAVAGKAAAATVDYTREAINAADATGKMAQMAGVAVEDFSRLAYTAGLNEVSTDQLKVALKGLSDELVKAGKSNADVLETLLATADEFAGMEDGAAKTTRAVQLFGKAGQDLIPLLNQGSEALREQMREADRFGLVIGSQFAGNADQFNDNLTRLKASFQGLWLQVANNALPSLIQFSETMVQVAENSNITSISVNALTGSFSLLSGIGKGIATSNIFGNIADGVARANPLVYGLAKAMEAVASRGQQITDANTIIGGLGSLITGAVRGQVDRKSVVVDDQDLEKALRIQDELTASLLSGGFALEEQQNLAFNRQLEQIEKLRIAEEDKAGLMFDLYASFEAKKTALHETGEFGRAQLEARMREANVEGFINTLRNMEGIQQASLQGRQQFLQTYQDLWMESHRTMFSYAAQGAQQLYQGLTNTLVSIATGAASAKEAFKQLGQQMVAMVVQFMAQRVVAFTLEKTLAASAVALQKAQFTATLAQAAALAGAHAAGATAASIATFGGATAFGALVPPLMAANAALGSSIALAAGTIGGAAHGGLDYVPKESTFLLDRGERVVSPEQNRDLTEFLRGGGGRTIQVQLVLDGRVLADQLLDMSQNGQLCLDGKCISGVKWESISGRPR